MEDIKETLQELFVDLHLSGHWSDLKAISDSILLAPADQILTAYRAAKASGPVDLKAFYGRWFRPVSGGDPDFATIPEHGPLEHLDRVWFQLMRPADDPAERSTRFPLPHPYVVVGGRFQEVYYWDSYFTQLGLLRTGRHDAVRNMLDNFAHAIDTIGHIPNGFRSYFLTRSQPPFFARMVADYGDATGDRAAALATYLPQIEAEYRFFMESPRNQNGLGRYWDSEDGPRVEMYGLDIEWAEHKAENPDFFRDIRAACESGWDFSARWLTDPADLGTIRTTKILPVDLNCLLLGVEELIAEAHSDTVQSSKYKGLSEKRRTAIRDRFFDPATGYFYDLTGSGELTKITTAAGLFPLWAGAASQEQAERAAAWMSDKLLAPGGLLTTDIESGQQWDAPNGWAPLNWIAIQGLRRYGMTDLANEIRSRWLATCDTVYRQTGKFVEKYNVISPESESGGGEYPLQDGFGWTNGVYLDLALEGADGG